MFGNRGRIFGELTEIAGLNTVIKNSLKIMIGKGQIDKRVMNVAENMLGASEKIETIIKRVMRIDEEIKVIFEREFGK